MNSVLKLKQVYDNTCALKSENDKLREKTAIDEVISLIESALLDCDTSASHVKVNLLNVAHISARVCEAVSKDLKSVNIPNSHVYFQGDQRESPAAYFIIYFSHSL